MCYPERERKYKMIEQKKHRRNSVHGKHSSNIFFNVNPFCSYQIVTI